MINVLRIMRRLLTKTGCVYCVLFMTTLFSNAEDHVKYVDLQSTAANIVKKKPNEYEWDLPDGKKRILTIDLNRQKINLNKFDEFRFEIMPLGSQVSLVTRIYGLPSEKKNSGWYLKFKAPVGKWSEGRYDLRVDDDGILVSGKDISAGIMKLTLGRRILGTPGEPIWRKALIRNPRFIKYMVKADFDLGECEIIENGAQISYNYKLKLENCTNKKRTVTIEPDSTGRLKYFSVTAPKQVILGRGEKKVIEITIGISRMRAMALPPLYSERIYPKIFIKGITDSDMMPLMGYRRWPIWGVVPIFNKISWTPETMRAFLDAREKAVPGIARWRTLVISNADAALKYDWPIPKDILPGHTMSYRITKSKGYPRPVNPTKFHKHIDQKTGKIYENNERLDRAYVGRYYGYLSKHVRNCSLAYLITGEHKYAKKAIDILISLADAYPGMPCAGIRSTSGGAKLGCNSLLASYVLPGLCEGFCFLNSVPELDETKRKKIRRFLRNEALMIARHYVGYNNQTAEHIRAYGSAAIATGFWPLAGEAVYGECGGWHEMVEYAFSEDGVGHEAGAYHRSIFGAMNSFASFALGQNVNLYTARFKRVFDGSLISGVKGVSFETAYKVYRDPAYIKMLADRKKRCDTELVFHGVLGIPDVKEIKVVSSIMPSAGYIFLRKGDPSNAMEIRLNYIKTFDRSEHDKFTTFFYKNGQQIDGTAGRIIYSSPHGHWMYETAAHNAIVIDGGNEADTDGELIAYKPDSNTPAAVVSTIPGNPFYKGVRQIRCIVIIDNVYIVFDRIRADRPHTIDRYQHGSRDGKVVFDPKSQLLRNPPRHLPKRAPFSNIEATKPVKQLDAAFGNGLKMRIVSDKEFSGFKAVCVAGWQAYPAEATFVRVENTKNVSFLAGFVFGKKSKLPELDVSKSDGENIIFTVKTHSGKYKVEIDVKNKKIAVKRLLNQ